MTHTMHVRPQVAVHAIMLLMSTLVSIILALDGLVTSHFSLIFGTKLRKYGFNSVDVRSLLDCGNYCSVDNRCLSFNFNGTAKSMAGACELNSATKRQANLTDATGYIYGEDLDKSSMNDDRVRFHYVYVDVILLQGEIPSSFVLSWWNTAIAQLNTSLETHFILAMAMYKS
jgi:hypothetical protein